MSQLQSAAQASPPSMTAHPASPPGAERRGGGAMIAVLAFSGIVVAVMQTLLVPIVAQLPGLLSTSAANATWVMTATLLAGAVATPIMGRLGDLFGKRRMMLVSLALMVVGSLVAAVSSELGPVVVGRALQGFAMGAIPLGISIMRDELPPQKLGSAMGLMSSSIGIGGALGLPGAAFVAQHADWHALFYSSAALGVVSMLLTVLLVPESGVRAKGRFDILGALGLSAALVAFLLPITKGDQWGWGSPTTLGFFGAAAALFLLWGVLELRIKSPLVDLRTTVRRQVLLTNIASIMVGVSFYAMSLVLPQVMELPKATGYGLGQSLVVAGLVMAPMGIAMMLVSPLSARLQAARGPKTALMLGLAIIAVGYGTGLGMLGSLWQIGITVTVIGAGIGFAYSSLPALIIGAVPPSETGAANGLNALMRSIGTSVSSAVVGMVLAHMTTSLGKTAVPSLSGFRTAFVIATGAALAGLVLAAFLPGRRRAKAAAHASADAPAPSATDAPAHVATDAPAHTHAPAIEGDEIPAPSLRGRVLSDGRPVAGAAVTLIDAEGRQLAHSTSNDAGLYALDVSATGRLLLIGSAPGHRPGAAPLTLGDTPAEFDLELSDVGGLRGSVLDAATGAALPEATVVVADRHGEVAAAATTGPDGVYDLTGLPAGAYTLAVRADGHRPEAVQVEVAGDAPVQQDIALRAAAGVSGTVRDADGRPLGDVKVTLLDHNGNVVAASSTDPDGTYAISDVPEADYTLVASGYAPVTASVALPGTGLDPVDLELSHAAHGSRTAHSAHGSGSAHSAQGSGNVRSSGTARNQSESVGLYAEDAAEEVL
ncbi:MFS transporter [Actinomadura barringtoniae]|uniref:MFS transporter n=1 Tax=Actinomadura barringtoniae TaxID=1427535 RepID=A0A939PPI0_9ACTN|nr:MFS transporter [Actinomadura barringtoniae]MBO2453749.1 MFS transporter [Actinomadura barringtoniae]